MWREDSLNTVIAPEEYKAISDEATWNSIYIIQVLKNQSLKKHWMLNNT